MATDAWWRKVKVYSSFSTIKINDVGLIPANLDTKFTNYYSYTSICFRLEEGN